MIESFDILFSIKSAIGPVAPAMPESQEHTSKSSNYFDYDIAPIFNPNPAEYSGFPNFQYT